MCEIMKRVNSEKRVDASILLSSLGFLSKSLREVREAEIRGGMRSGLRTSKSCVGKRESGVRRNRLLSKSTIRVSSRGSSESWLRQLVRTPTTNGIGAQQNDSNCTGST